jgi:hypothetical protein
MKLKYWKLCPAGVAAAAAGFTAAAGAAWARS